MSATTRPKRRQRVSGELTVTDLFCGAGGSSSGLSTLPGVKVIIAANHWALAIESHQANHPNTDHSNADISQVEPSWFPTTDILWASPECTNHSVAKGIKRQRAVNEALFELDGSRPMPDEAAIRSRATMWDVPRFAEYHHYKAIIIENVVDAYRWVQFPAWLMAMELLGYEHEIVWLNSMHAQALGLPAPQSRDRMYVIFWLKGNRAPDLQKWTRPKALCETHGIITAMQVFKKKEHWGRYRAQYVYRCPKCAVVVEPGWLPAASAIDWNIQGTRIGDREKPLSPKTMKRIEKGIDRYWKPIVVTAMGNTYDGINTGSNYLRAYPTDTPLPVQQTTLQHGLALPPLITDGIRGEGTVQSGTDPMLTQTTAQTKGVAFPAFLAQFRERERLTRLDSEVMPTIVADGANHAVITSPLFIPVEGRDGKNAAPGSEPLRTQSTRNETAIVVPLRNNGVAKSSLVTGPVDVNDCEFRMLTPDEIKVGMAFARDYILLGTKREQVRQSGNAVTPPAARDLGAAVIESLGFTVEVAA